MSSGLQILQIWNESSIEYLSELYYKGQSGDKKYRFQPQIVKKYQHCIYLLETVTSVEILYQYNSLNYEVLKGNKTSISSIRINDQYQIEFTVTIVKTETVITIPFSQLFKSFKLKGNQQGRNLSF